jgi:DNA-binding beta-propeller fold protein YncE
MILIIILTKIIISIIIIIIINNNNIIDHNKDKIERKKEEGRRRIKDFFDKENIIALYSSLLSLDHQPPSSIISSMMVILDEAEKKRRNEMIMNNQLKINENLITSFGSFGSNPSQFNHPQFLTMNAKMNIMAVSDCNNNRVQIFDMKGNHRGLSFDIQYPRGIVIIPSRSLLAVCSSSTHRVHLFDLSPLLNHHHSNNDIPHLIDTMIIGKGNGSANDQLNNPNGIAYNEEMDFIVVCDGWNNQIQIYKLSTNQYHSSIPLSFEPYDIDISFDISSSSLLIVISDYIYDKVHIYRGINDENGVMTWSVLRSIGSSRNGKYRFTNPSGVAINRSAKYIAVCDRLNGRVQLFSLSSGDFITSFKPTLISSSSSPHFKQPCGICVDVNDHLIAVSDTLSHSITLFLSPFFS